MPHADTPPRTRRDLRRAAKRWRFPVFAALVAVLCIAGTGVLLYPTAAAWTQQYAQSQNLRDLAETIDEVGAQQLADEVAKARDYNATLTGGALVAAGERKPQSEGDEVAGYNDLLNADGNGLIGRIQIPRIDADLAIYHGTSDDVLEEGVGHLEGTAFPVGGLGTHSVLTAHRGLATADLFTHLDQVEIGDTFTVSAFGEVHTYRVRDTQVVLPDDTELLNAVPGEDLITLVTCTPLGVNSHRILVTGERIIPTPIEQQDAADRGPEVPRFPWWALIFGGVIVLGGVYIWFSGRPPRRRRRPEPRHPSPAKGDQPAPQPRPLPVVAPPGGESERPYVPVDAAVRGLWSHRRPTIAVFVQIDTAGHLGPSHLDLPVVLWQADRWGMDTRYGVDENRDTPGFATRPNGT